MAEGQLQDLGKPPESGIDPADFCDPDPFSASVAGTDFTFFPKGKDRLDALIALIDGAETSLKMFYYLFLQDEIGERVREAIVAASKRGVSVDLLVDSFGSAPKQEFFEPIIDAGGRYGVFMSQFGSRYLIRNHQKMAIADDRIAMMGGFNVSRHYFDPPDCNGWNDLGVRLEGPAVAQLVRWYGQLANWTESRGENFRAIRLLVRHWQPDEGPVQLVLGGPTRIPSSWAMRVKQDIARASRLDLVMAYFSPPRSYRRLIRRVAERGRVRLVMAGKSDNTTTIAAARALYRQFLQSGAKIYEFKPCKMHTKLVVVDDVVYVGSANFDMRSLRINLEMMMRIEDKALADRMREFADGFVEHSWSITQETYEKHDTLWNRIRWWFGWTVVSVLDYNVSRRLNIRA